MNKAFIKATADKRPIITQFEDPAVPYAPGKVINTRNETFFLVERDSEIPTSEHDALVRWRVEFKNRYGDVLNPQVEYYRYIREAGNPATVKAEKIPGLEEPVKPDEPKWVDTSEDAEPIEKGPRGRPEGPMNELKAKNLFRGTINGSIEYNDEKLYLAFEHLVSIGQEKIAENYLNKLTQKMEK